MAGLAAMVLAIVGLMGILSVTLASVCLITIAAALLIEGGSVATRAYRFAARGAPVRDVPAEVAGGLSSELLAALAGMALGILALVGVDPYVLLPVGVIVVGVGLMFGSAAISRVNSLAIGGAEPPGPRGEILRESVYAASGAHVLVGLAALVLGIVALLGNVPITLTLVAELVLGGTIVLSGAAIGGRIVGTFHR
jgi:hypothetical protein